MYGQDQGPDIPAALATLNHLSNADLGEILNDDGRFEEIVKDIKQFKDLESEKEVLIAGNRSLAEVNLAKQPQLEENKKALQELSEKGCELCTSVQEKITELKEKSGATSVESALELLQAAAAEIEEESEKIAEKFLSGDTEVDEFLDQFLTRRKIMHLRKVKVDKMRELKRKPTSRSSTGPGYPPPSNFPSPKFLMFPERLRIKVIPTIALISDSKTKDYIVGFTDLGNCDDFSTEMMEWRIAQSGAISYTGDLLNPPEKGKKSSNLLVGNKKSKTIRGRTNSDDSGSDDE
ncbi:thioredoxin domain-containing protein 9 isoform X2 [Diachasma alloeum]|uniref:thioredoxin domain-containing protein 9 isoform X2 n=1 Tax=Diachasma alloeum TaxID=454923 RepID=UPI0010FBAC63|nr:thioredoxin domain-containing protein 9 isoform X2 [Diachasma alloeum]